MRESKRLRPCFSRLLPNEEQETGNGEPEGRLREPTARVSAASRRRVASPPSGRHGDFPVLGFLISCS